MENASDALIMAGSVLLLIIALTVSISSLSGLRTQAQDILSERKKLQYAQDSNGNYLNYLKDAKEDEVKVRKVGIETVMASISRMRKESYTIYIATDESINVNDDLKDNTITRNIIGSKNVLKLTMDGTGNKYVDDSEVKGKIYNKLSKYTFDEYIGVYQWKSLATEANKDTFKIITFVQNGTV